jgi:predicted phosphoadenosine phosphosulfate sulfurtransferase
VKRVYLDKTVREATRERIEWLYDEFPTVVVNTSGGKDSTVALETTLEVARERGRLPLPVMFIDQEAEWQSAIDYVRRTADRDEIEMHWLQMPLRISNATSPWEPWLYCWKEGAEWIRPKEPDSIHDNPYGTLTFADLFQEFLADFAEAPACFIGGVRCEESPARTLGLTIYETYKGETWGKKHKRTGYFDFYPLYDWRLSDVWHAIEEGGWDYAAVYDTMYRMGVPRSKMRVSNLHHAPALADLFLVHEIEPETWDRLSERLPGVNAAGHLNWSAYRVDTLPTMFRTWVEYRDYLMETLLIELDPAIRDKLVTTFARYDARYAHDPETYRKLIQTQIGAVLVGDYWGMKLSVFEAASLGKSKNRGKRSGRTTIE